jgi:hypothetical protein
MASRAHVIHDYSFTPPVRQRRAVWLHNDEKVVLPRSRSVSGGGALLISAALACALTAGLSYAVYRGQAPVLGETQAAPLSRSWELDPTITKANVTNQLSGPAFAVPSVEGRAAVPADGWADAPLTSDASTTNPASTQDAPRSLQSASGLAPDPIQEQLPNAPDVSSGVSGEPVAPYPNPTTTPPEAIAPAEPAPMRAPGTDPENPYTD